MTLCLSQKVRNVWNGFNTDYDSFRFFSFWDMVDFVLKIPCELETYSKKIKFYVRGLHFPKSPGSDLGKSAFCLHFIKWDRVENC